MVLKYFNYVYFFSESAAKSVEDDEQDAFGTVFLSDHVTRSSYVL